MEFQNCIRNEYGKCDIPSNTINRIKNGLRKLDLDAGYLPFKVSDNIYWGRAWIDSIRVVCNGKGITPELAEASAYAELAERLSAGLFYPVFEEQVRFNAPALYNEETNRFLNYEWMKGYVHAYQDNLENPLKIVPSITLDSVDNPIIKDMIGFYNSKNVDVILKDLSFDGRLPCIGALFTNNNLRSDRLEHRILIPGASFTQDEGLTRCFTESMQGRETLMACRPQLDRPVAPRSHVDDFYMLMKCCVSLTDISFLEQGETRNYQSIKLKDVFGEIEEIKKICRLLNTDCIILDHTHPILNFAVVRVIIPRVSDFLPFLRPDILVSEATKPSTAWRGEEFSKLMQSFFA